MKLSETLLPLALFATVSVTNAASPGNAPPLPITGTRILRVATEPQLQTAMGNLQNGDTILLADGIYNLTSSLYINGRNNITVRGTTGSAGVVLAGKGMDNREHGGVPFGIWSNGTNTTIAHLTIRDTWDNEIIFNPGAQSPHVYCVRLLNAGSQFIKSNPTDVKAGVGVNNGVVEYCWFEYTGNPPGNHSTGAGYFNGISAHAAQNWTIRGNLFKNLHNPDGSAYPWNAAVLLWRHAANTVTEQNIFFNVDRAVAYGLDNTTPYFDHDGGVIRNNFVYLTPGLMSARRKASSDGSLIAWNSPGTQIDHNTVLLNGNEFYAIEFRFATTTNGTARNNLADAPIHLRDNATATVNGNFLSAVPGMFANPSNADLHLLATATNVIDKAPTLVTVTNDFDGDLRPRARSDIGADEFTTNAPPVITDLRVSSVNTAVTSTTAVVVVNDVPRSDDVIGGGSSPTTARPKEDRWWPVQRLPNAVVRTENQQDFPAPRAALQMMVQSVAGLAAKAVNEGRGNELVWVSNGNIDLEDWYARLLAAHPDLEKRGTFDPWALVDGYAKRGIIKGYILYRLDKSRGDLNTYRPGMDCSVNVATSMAGLLDGVIVDEELEKEAKAHGLTLLLDVRDKTQAWCFQTYKNRFNRRMLCTQDPAKPHVRDLAIAQKAFTVYGKQEPTPAAMKWLEPLSPILGWNGGDEFATTDLSTSYAQIQTATDWCMNLPILMAGSEKHNPSSAKRLDPATIDWSDTRSAVSFVGTDGDNVQWFQGNFFRGSESRSYWSSPDRGRNPYGWSCCFAHLAQLCPPTIEYACTTRLQNDYFVEWGAGYYYPDRFGRERPNRWELLAGQARRTWEAMKATGTRIIGFNFSQYDSPEARKAYEVFASQTDGLLAILVFQYAPYEAGAGNAFWVKDRNGVDLPVVTARYSIWEHQNSRERSGTPAKIAREIRQTVEKTPQERLPRYDWVIAHAWSYFKRAPGTDENAEDLPQGDAADKGGVRGYSPVIWCGERLPASIRIVSPEELAWRIRMKHDPAQTKRFMSQWR